MYQFEIKSLKHHSSNIFVKDCITTALFKLLEMKNFDKITITDIVEKAGVSRMGYYRNYKSKEDIIETYVYEKFVETVKEIEKERPIVLSMQNIMYTSLTVFKKYAHQIKLLLDKNLDMLLYKCYEKAFEYLFPNRIKSKVQDYFYKMLISDIYTIEMNWIKNGMIETPQELTNMYIKLTKLKAHI